MVARLRNGEVEIYDSVPNEGLEVSVLEHDEEKNVVLVRAESPVPEVGIEEGDESWVESESIV